ncbi:MAG: hypothetical protein JJU36_02575 [Phycisphaeraceae bacterium]|nr:hypothetical protein [Phycisphaeraceae bacterium]
MPTYDYQCDACGHELELFQNITAKPIRKCPACGKLKLRRLIGIGAGVLFKGSGFYETDYRSEGYKKAAKAEQGGSTDSKDSTAKKDSAAESKTGGSDAKAGKEAPAAAPSSKSGDGKAGASKESAGPKSTTKTPKAKP